MTVIRMKSDEARSKFRDLLDHVFSGATQVVIERYNKPTAVVIGYREWEKLIQLQKEQRQERILNARREMDAGTYFTEEQVDADLRQKGLID
ncbi:MAG: type II toxin-antitoxin system Phd/YefM family antitoxin [Caldilineaceae bacterium]